MLDYVPKSVAVIGGGAIGCEFASTFADLGAKVTILEFLPKILPGCDTDVANVVVRVVPEAGHHDPHRRQGDGPRAHAATRHDGARSTAASRSRSTPSIVSVGRRPYADLLGLDGTAVKVDRPGLRRGRRAGAAPASPASTPSATSSRRAAARPRRLRRGDHGRSRTSSARRRCRSTTTRCRGRSTATPRSRSPATPRRRPRTPASTS